jgi:hypothetical protein
MDDDETFCLLSLLGRAAEDVTADALLAICVLSRVNE